MTGYRLDTHVRRCRWKRAVGRYAAVGWVAVTILAVGCRGETEVGDGSGLVIDTVANTIHVLNGPGRESRARSYQLRELWRRGGVADTGSAQFTGPEMAIATGPDHLVAVLDMRQATVTVFDESSGETLNSVGRAGRGPGEFSSPAGLAWDSMGRLWVANAVDGRYNIFDRRGQLLDTRKRPTRSVNVLPFPLEFQSDGQLRDHRKGFPTIDFLWLDPGIGTVDSLTVRHPDIGALNGALPPRSALDLLWLRPLLKWDFEKRSNSTWLARSDSLLLWKVGHTGETTVRVTFSHRRLEFTAEQEAAIARAGRDLPPKAGFTPVVILGVHALQDGRVLLQISEGSPNRSSTFDVFDRQGGWLGTLRTPLPVHATSRIASTGDTLLLTMIGAMDVPVVTRSVIQDVGPLHVK